MIERSGFSLVELLLVVVLLAVLALIVVPHFSQAGVEARSSTLATNLRRARSQIELYKLHHNDQLPATSGETPADFARRMTTQTDASGNPGADFGPYLQRVLVNPFNDSVSVRIDGAAAGVNIDGWRFDTMSGAFQADDSPAHALF